MDLQLKNKKALVLAASQGIGRGVALALAREGCHVIIASSSLERLQAAKTEISAQTQSRVDIQQVDLTSEENSAAAAREIVQKHGIIDILIANGPGPEITDAATAPLGSFKKAFQANFLSIVQFCQALIPGMIQNKFGRIVLLTSTTAKEPDPGMVLSNTMRAAVMAYGKTLSREIAAQGITVNTILTGGVQTDRILRLREVNAKRLGVPVEELARKAPLAFPVGFIATPEQFATAITFISSPLAGYLNGVSLALDGGYMKGM